MKSINTILFDAGGTLVGSDNLFDVLIPEFRCSEITPQIVGAEFAKEKAMAETEFSDVKGLLRKVCSNLSNKYSIEDIGDKACDLYRHTYTETVYLYEDVLETLQKLNDRDLRLILVSDADSDVLNPQFEKLGLDVFFKERFVSSDIHCYKPSDKTESLLRQTVDQETEGMLFVGDSPEDVAIAQKLGIDSIFIGKSSKSATYVISCFKELWPLLLKHYQIGCGSCAELFCQTKTN